LDTSEKTVLGESAIKESKIEIGEVSLKDGASCTGVTVSGSVLNAPTGYYAYAGCKGLYTTTYYRLTGPGSWRCANANGGDGAFVDVKTCGAGAYGTWTPCNDKYCSNNNGCKTCPGGQTSCLGATTAVQCGYTNPSCVLLSPDQLQVGSTSVNAGCKGSYGTRYYTLSPSTLYRCVAFDGSPGTWISCA